MRSRLALSALTLALSAALLPAGAQAAPPAGADGIGDAYFPLDGNGGIDVYSYDINDRYRFGNRKLSGSTTLVVRATQSLSSFNLDFLLPVRDVRVNGEPATFTRPTRHELTITPASPLTNGQEFRVRVRYDGYPGFYKYAGEKNWLANKQGGTASTVNVLGGFGGEVIVGDGELELVGEHYADRDTGGRLLAPPGHRIRGHHW